MVAITEAFHATTQREFNSPLKDVPKLIELAPDSSRHYIDIPTKRPEPRLLLTDAFNATRFQTTQGEYAIARRLLGPPTPHGIDYNRIVVFKIESGHARELHELQIPTPLLPSRMRITNWEDFRAFVAKDTTPNGQTKEVIILGGTAVGETDTYSTSNRSTAYVEEIKTMPEIPRRELPIFAGFVKAYVATDGESIIVNEVAVAIDAPRQKNVTVINHRDGKTTFLTRLENDNYNHTLSVFTFDHATHAIQHVGNIPVPHAWWNSERIGTQGTEIIIDDNGDSYLPIHGQVKKRVTTHTGTYDKITYRMGLLRQKPTGEIEVSPEPTFERSHFYHLVAPSSELRVEKEVIYCCSHSRRNGGVVYDFALGDQQNIFDVYQSLEEIREAFPREQTVYICS